MAGLMSHSCKEELPKDLLEPSAAQDILSKGIFEGKKEREKKEFLIFSLLLSCCFPPFLILSYREAFRLRTVEELESLPPGTVPNTEN